MPVHEYDESDIDTTQRVTPAIPPPPSITPTGNAGPQGGGSDPTNYQKTGTATQSYGKPDNKGTSGPAPSTTTCGGITNLDKRISVFRTHDKALWFMWLDTLYSNATNDISPGDTTTSSTEKTSYPQGTTVTAGGVPVNNAFIIPTGKNHTTTTPAPASSSLSDQTIFSVTDPLNPNTTIKTTALTAGDEILFYTRTLNESFNIPSDPNGVINNNVFWCLWSDGTNLKPIKGAKYFNLWYDDDLHTLDLVFWANINVDDLKVKAKDMYDSVRNPQLSDGSLDPKAQRVVFYSKGIYRQVVTTRKKGVSEATGMFIFSKPLMILNPGAKSGNTADPVVDEDYGFRFLELQ